MRFLLHWVRRDRYESSTRGLSTPFTGFRLVDVSFLIVVVVFTSQRELYTPLGVKKLKRKGQAEGLSLEASVLT